MADKASVVSSPTNTSLHNDAQRLKVAYNASYNGGTEYDEERVLRERGRKRLRWLGLMCVVLVVAGAAVGLGVGLGVREKKHAKVMKSRPVAGPAPLSSSDFTVDQLVFLPQNRSHAKYILKAADSKEARAAWQMLDDTESITPEVIINFLDYFDRKAKLTEHGVDIEYLKSQAFNVARWLKARPGLSAVLNVLRRFSKDPNFDLVELAEAIDQLIGGLKVKDFMQFLAWPSDKDKAFNASALMNMVELTLEEELGGLPSTDAGTLEGATSTSRASNRRTNTKAQYTDPINLALLQANPTSFINNPKDAGLPGFNTITIPVVFHVLQYFDAHGYTYPYNAYSQGNKPGLVLIEQMNRAYAAANVKFVLKEWRSNPKTYSYLKIGQLQAWQSCATQAETCTCSLAKMYSVSPRKVMNVWVVGSANLDYADMQDIAYATYIPGVMDSCKEVMAWQTPDSASRHLWLSWDMADPDSANNPLAWHEGSMTLIHEVGHYLGLLHTHEGDCQDLDKVSDTPANLVIQDQYFNMDLQKWCISNYGKKLKPSPALQRALSEFDSCKNKPYVDNFGNFMSYVHSSCYRLFTVGQIRRMQKTIKTYHSEFK